MAKENNKSDPSNDRHVSAESGMQLYRVVGDLSDDTVGSDTTIFDMYLVLRANLLKVVLIAGAFTLAAVAYALLATPIFRSEILLAPADERSLQSTLLGQLGGLASLAGVSVGGAGNSEAIAVLRSREFTREFIEEYNLMPILFEEEWDAKNNRWESADPDDWPDIRDGVKYFDRNVRRVREDKASGLVTLAIEWIDSQTAAEWANILIHRLNAKLRQQALDEAEINIEYLRTQLADTNVVTLQQSIGGLLEMELQKLMLAKGSEEFAFKIIDHAEPARRRSKPKRTIITILGTVVGSVFAVVFVLVSEGIQRRVARSGPK